MALASYELNGSLPNWSDTSSSSGGSQVMDRLMNRAVDKVAAPAATAAMAAANPWLAAATIAAPVLGQALKDTPNLSSATQNVGFDSSNWNVNFGGGTITSTAEKTQTAQATANPVSWVFMAAGVLSLALVVRAWKG